MSQRSIHICAFLIVAAFTGALCGFLFNARPDDVVYVSPAVQDLGLVDPNQHETVKAVFVLHNATREVLTIKQTLASCMCSEFVCSRDRISPYQTAELSMTIRTKNLRGPQSITGLITTSNPRFPSFELTALCNVTSDGKISPFDVNLPDTTPSEVIDYKWELPLLDATVSHLSESSLSDGLWVDFENFERDQRRLCRFVFRGTAPDQPGQYSYSCKAFFPDVKESTDVHVYLRVRSRFGIDGPLSFGLVKERTEAFQKLRIRDNRGKPIKAVSLASHVGQLSIADSQWIGPTQELLLKFIPDGTREFYDEELEFIVESEDGSKHKLSVLMLARLVRQKQLRPPEEVPSQ